MLHQFSTTHLIIKQAVTCPLRYPMAFCPQCHQLISYLQSSISLSSTATGLCHSKGANLHQSPNPYLHDNLSYQNRSNFQTFQGSWYLKGWKLVRSNPILDLEVSVTPLLSLHTALTLQVLSGSFGNGLDFRFNLISHM